MRGQAASGGGFAGSSDALQQMHTAIPDCRPNLRGIALAHPAAVLPHSLVPHLVQSVLDAPVLPRPTQQFAGRAAVPSQAGYAVDHFDLRLVLQHPHPLQLKDLADIRPVQVVVQSRCARQRPDLLAAVPLVHRAGRLFLSLFLLTLVGGKSRRRRATPLESGPLAPTGCP